MPQLAYPSAADLESYLLTLGIYPSEMPREELAALDLAGKAAAAVAEWEARTFYRPFLGSGSDTTRRFDAPCGSALDLRGGLVALTSVFTGVSSESAGTELTAETQFWLEPSNAAEEGRPYETVRFVGMPYGGPRSIAITGRWGYWSTVPDDAWQAILMRGALFCAPQVGMAMSGGAETVRVLSSEVRYPTAAQGGPLSPQAAGWRAAFEEAVRRYKRVFAT